MAKSSSDATVAPTNSSTVADVHSSKTKKRKIRASKGDEATTDLSKEERKERKRLKKLRDDENAEVQVDGTALNGSDENAARANRKTEKTRLNALRKEGHIKTNRKQEPNTDPNELAGSEKDDFYSKKDKTESMENGQLSKSASKEARKAEKARSRASRDLQNDKGAMQAVANAKPTTALPSDYHEDPNLSALPQPDIDSFLSSNFVTITDPIAFKILRPIISFSHLPASARHEGSSSFASFKNPTPIQAAAWPFLLSGRDVVGIAETGSGKTLAFGVPCIRHISSLSCHETTKRSNAARAVIISPTRELAVQIYEQIIQLARPAGMQAVCVYGGVPKDAQRLALKSAHIIVATPGRLNDFISEGSADLSGVSYLVLDEADRMLDKGFEEEIRKIIATTPLPQPAISRSLGRQTLMFTATWPPSVRDLASTFMQSPVKIIIGDNPTGELRANTRIVQKVEVLADPRSKETRLLQLVKQYQSGKSKDDRILVFCLYKKEATRVENFLRTKGLRVVSIHGDLSQEKRTSSLEAFKRVGGIPLLVATDVAARGLDIPAVKVVINVTFPLTVEDYVHRIGRTGRAGAQGLAITLFTDHDKAQSGPLINVLKAAGQEVPDQLLKYGTTVKKKGHEAYGAFYKETTESAKGATKIKFDD